MASHGSKRASVPSRDLPTRRSDIQGLRAIAVLMVVAFHSGLPLPGGFVGVDVFFVISGFVITAMLQREWSQTGRLQLRRFYWRRFYRLTPALALMISVTMLVSYLVLSPLGLQQAAAETAIGAMLLFANFVIAQTTGNYFGTAAEMNPLLNTWSLSVEEQFYLVFPALIGLSWSLARHRGLLRFSPTLLVSAVTVVSFALALAGSAGLAFRGSDLILGFYSPFTRAWEFAAGALLALAVAKGSRFAARTKPVMGVIGFGILACSLWLITDTTPFPGVWTLLPVTGTLLLLYAGTDQDALTTRLLGKAVMVRIGDWSYSIYLWHWPLIVFASYIWPASQIASMLAVVVSFGPALVSYYWVEQPLRQMSFKGERHPSLLTAIIATPLSLSVLVAGISTYYWTPRFQAGTIKPVHPGDLGQQARFSLMQDNYYPCTLEQIEDAYQYHLGVHRCMQSRPNSNVDVAILGDSHAEHLFLGLAEALPQMNVLYVYLHGWPARNTENSQETFKQVAASPSVKVVVINSRWSAYGPTSVLSQSIDELVRAHKRVLLADGTPDFPGLDPYLCKFGTWLSSTRCSRDAGDFQHERNDVLLQLENIAEDIPQAMLLRTSQYFCSPDTCNMTHEGRLLYEDEHHLNSEGSRYIARRILADNPALMTLLSSQ